jgi:hypothetical protein
MVNIISALIDTLKLHYYPPNIPCERWITPYHSLLETLKEHKVAAQAITHTENARRCVPYTFGRETFHVQATTFQGFSITLRNQDITLSLKHYSNAKNPLLKVEFRAHYLARAGYVKALEWVNALITDHLLPQYRIKVSEIHLAKDIQGHRFTPLDYYRFQVPSRQRTLYTEKEDEQLFFEGMNFLGFVFGRGDCMVRIYNKTEEIKKYPNKAFIATTRWVYSPQYDPHATTWRIEVQIRREAFKRLFASHVGLLDGFEVVLNEIPALWDRMLSRFKYLHFSDDEATLLQSGTLSKEALKKRRQRAGLHPLWEMLAGWNHITSESLGVFHAPSVASKQYAFNALRALLSTVLKAYGNLTPELLERVVLEAQEDAQRRHGETLVDLAIRNGLDYFGRVEYVRYQYGEEIPLHETLKTTLHTHLKHATSPLFAPFAHLLTEKSSHD